MSEQTYRRERKPYAALRACASTHFGQRQH